MLQHRFQLWLHVFLKLLKLDLKFLYKCVLLLLAHIIFELYLHFQMHMSLYDKSELLLHRLLGQAFLLHELLMFFHDIFSFESHLIVYNNIFFKSLLYLVVLIFSLSFLLNFKLTIVGLYFLLIYFIILFFLHQD